MTASSACAGFVEKRTACNKQKLPPFCRGAPTRRPVESRMLLNDVIEHRCPDFTVPWHRATAIDERGGGKCAALQRAGARDCSLVSLAVKKLRCTHTLDNKQRIDTILNVRIRVPSDLAENQPNPHSKSVQMVGGSPIYYYILLLRAELL